MESLIAMVNKSLSSTEKCDVTCISLPSDSKSGGTPYEAVARFNACVRRFSRSWALILSKSNKEGLEINIDNTLSAISTL